MELENSIAKQSSENYIRELIFILSVRKTLIFFVLAVIFIAVLLIAFLWPASYTSTAKLLVSRKPLETSLETLETVDYRIEDVSKEDLNSEAQLLQSEDLIVQVILKLQSEGIVFNTEQENQKRWLMKQVARVKSGLVVDLIPYSKVLDISFTWDNPEYSQLILSRLIQHYMDFRNDLKDYSGKRNVLIDITNTFLERLKKGNTQLVDLMRNKRIVEPNQEIKNNLEIKFSLEKSLKEIELNKIEIDQKITLLNEKLRNRDIQFFSFIENEAINQFAKQLQELFIEKAKLEGVFVSASKAVKGVNMQLETAYKNLLAEVNSLKSELESQSRMLSDQITLLEAKIRDINKRNTELKMAALNMEMIEKENSVLENSFQTFFKRKEEASLAFGLGSSRANVVVLSHPGFPLSPTFPNKKILIPFGFIVACLSGLIVGFLAEFFDHRFKRPEDITNVVGLKNLISIADVSSGGSI